MYKTLNLKNTSASSDYNSDVNSITKSVTDTSESDQPDDLLVTPIYVSPVPQSQPMPNSGITCHLATVAYTH